MMCKHGHICGRRKDGHCIECAKLAVKRWADRHPHAGAVRSKKYDQTHKEKRRQYRISHKKESVVRTRLYRTRHSHSEDYRLRAAIATAKRRALKKTAGGLILVEDITRIRKQQHNRCAYCRRHLDRDCQIDHIFPLSKGGSNYPRNVQLTCQSCNHSKRDRDPLIFARELGMLV